MIGNELKDGLGVRSSIVEVDSGATGEDTIDVLLRTKNEDGRPLKYRCVPDTGRPRTVKATFLRVGVADGVLRICSEESCGVEVDDTGVSLEENTGEGEGDGDESEMDSDGTILLDGS